MMLPGGNNGYQWMLKWNILQLLLTVSSAQYRNRTATTCTYDQGLFNVADSPIDTRGFLRLDCEPDETNPQVIHILGAIYGVSLYETCRHNLGDPIEDPLHNGPYPSQPIVSPGDTCKEDGTQYSYIRECNGMRHCKIPTYSRVLDCPSGDRVKSHYLQIEFQCIPGIFNEEEDSICGGVRYPEENYEAVDDDGFGKRRRRDASNPEDTLPHIDDAHYRVTFPVAFLTSPNYPRNYPNYMHCECYLQTHLDASIVFRVLDFEIEQGESCMYDYLQFIVADRSRSFCAEMTRDNLPSDKPNVRIVMRTDDRVTRSGFRVQFWAQLGNIVVPSEGVHSYIQIGLCMYQCPQITSHPKWGFGLNIGMSIGPLSDRYCDTLPKGLTVNSHANFIHVEMESDDSVSFKGFWAEYWGQRGDGRRVPVRSKCGRYTGSVIPDSIPAFPGENTGVSVSVSVPSPTPEPSEAPIVAVKPPPPTTRKPTLHHTRLPVGQITGGSKTTPIPDTSSPASSTDDNEGGLNMSIIIGAAAAGVLLIVVLVIIAIVLCCRRKAANRALKTRHVMSSSMSDLSGRGLPPAPNVPAPKIPTAPSKEEKYVGLNGDHVTYKSPPGSAYTTLDSKGSSLHGVKVLPDPLQLKVPLPPYIQYPANPQNVGIQQPGGFINPEYSDTQDEHIYAEIYDEIAKFPRNSGAEYQNNQSYTNNAYTNGAKTNEYQNYLNAHAHKEKIHVNIINGSNNESHDYDHSYQPSSNQKL